MPQQLYHHQHQTVLSASVGQPFLSNLSLVWPMFGLIFRCAAIWAKKIFSTIQLPSWDNSKFAGRKGEFVLGIHYWRKKGKKMSQDRMMSLFRNKFRMKKWADFYYKIF
jgi:hypothetical protein